MSAIAYLKTDCDHCSGPIEFPTELAGQGIECPHCQQVTTLPAFNLPPVAIAPPPPVTTGFAPTASPPIPRRAPTTGQICERCGSVGKPVSRTKGSFVIEVVLWLMLILPGLIYSLWRLTSREKVCGQCEGQMIGIGTPRGQQLWHTYHG